MDRLGRRGFATSLVGIGLAGCLSDNTGPTGLGEHLSSVDLDEVAQLGPRPTEADGVIVAFMDPSCSSCAVFTKDTFPQLRDGPIELGSLSYIERLVPWVIPAWSRPAIHALHAVLDSDPQSYWKLKSAYYQAQGDLDAETIMAWTLSECANLGVDAEVVRSAMMEDRYRDRISAAEESAGANGVVAVPSFLLFTHGELLTSVTGPQPYDVFEGAMDL